MPDTLIRRGKAGNAGTDAGASQDAEWASEKLGDSLPGLPSQHFAAWQYFLGMCGGDSAHHQNGEPIFPIDYDDQGDLELEHNQHYRIYYS